MMQLIQGIINNVDYQLILIFPLIMQEKRMHTENVAIYANSMIKKSCVLENKSNFNCEYNVAILDDNYSFHATF